MTRPISEDGLAADDAGFATAPGDRAGLGVGADPHEGDDRGANRGMADAGQAATLAGPQGERRDDAGGTIGSRRASRLLWGGLVLTLAVAIGAGAWSAIHRSSGSAGTSAGGGPDAGPTSGAADSAAGVSWLEKASEERTDGGADGLPIGDPLPDFSLTERGGRTVTRADLAGKVWVANFIFTRCPNVCPDLTRRVSDIRSRLAASGADDVLTVSFTVDPIHDTPAVLSDYADSFHADPSSWLFLGGDPQEVFRVVKDGFHLMMVDPSAGSPVHSNRFVLVDARGRMRATHLGTDEGVAERIVKEALALRAEDRG